MDIDRGRATGSGQRRPVECFRCHKTGHFARDCNLARINLAELTFEEMQAEMAKRTPSASIAEAKPEDFPGGREE
jgi:hypothetical protein